MAVVTESQRSGSNVSADDDVRRTRGVLVWAGILGVIAIALFAIRLIGQEHPLSAVVSAVGVLLGLSGAGLTAGALMGFLFGIPRTLQRASEHQQEGTEYQVNTNLEQISDWLTKIIVGVGLIQFRQLPRLAVEMNAYVAASLPNGSHADAFVGSIALYSAVCGFFTGYLATRLYLAGAFVRAEHFGGLIAELTRDTKFVDTVSGAVTLQQQMLSSLYEPPPGGFNQALALADDYRKQYGDATDRVWLYLACAHAQRHSWLIAKQSTSDDIKSARDDAMAALKRFLDMNPTQKAYVRELATGNDFDNDFVSLRDDPAFQQLVS